jgi:glycosyltransferase involved in cell wall biosynthesis
MNTRYRLIIGNVPVDDSRTQIVNELALELVRRGHQVVLVINKDHEIENNKNLIVHKWPTRRATKLSDARFLAKLIDQYKPDCLLSEGFATSRVMMLTGKFKRVPCLVNWYHTLQTALIINMPWWRRRVPGLATWNGRRILNTIVNPYLITCSQAASQELQIYLNIPASKTMVIYSLMRDRLSENGQPSTTNYESNHFMLVGRLNIDKGPDIVVRAVAILKPRYPDVCVEFVGRGILKDVLINLATELGVKENCLFVGQLSNDEVVQRMASVCATILPSRSEALGLVAIESISVGTPVIGSDVGGIPEVIRDGVEGLRFMPEDYKELAQHMETLMTQPELRAEMSKNARNTFLTQFTVANNIHKVAGRLERMVTKELAVRKRSQDQFYDQLPNNLENLPHSPDQ